MAVVLRGAEFLSLSSELATLVSLAKGCIVVFRMSAMLISFVLQFSSSLFYFSKVTVIMFLFVWLYLLYLPSYICLFFWPLSTLKSIFSSIYFKTHCKSTPQLLDLSSLSLCLLGTWMDDGSFSCCVSATPRQAITIGVYVSSVLLQLSDPAVSVLGQ